MSSTSEASATASQSYPRPLGPPQSPRFHSPCLTCPPPQVYVHYDPTLTGPHAFTALIVTNLRSSGTSRTNAVFMCEYTRTVPSTMMVYGLQYGSFLISYRITPVLYGRMPLRYGAQP